MRGMLANKDQTCKNFTELHRGRKKIYKKNKSSSALTAVVRIKSGGKSHVMGELVPINVPINLPEN